MHQRYLLGYLFMLLAICSAAPVWAETPEYGTKLPARVIVGWVEKISLLPFGDIVKAKLDTGAATSSINTQALKRFVRDGKKWVSFELQYKTAEGEVLTHVIEKPISRNIRVKEHEGENGRRPVVDLTFCFNGAEHTTQFSLVDRSKFVYPVLLGRRFLAGTVVIDPKQTFLANASCKSAGKTSATK